MFHSFQVLKQGQSTYLYFPFLSVLSSGQPERQSTIRQVNFIIIIIIIIIIRLITNKLCFFQNIFIGKPHTN